MIDYSWMITGLDTVPSENGLSDVVKTIHYIRLASKDGDILSMEGVHSCDTPNADQYINYADLTQADVEGWLNSANISEHLDLSLSSQFDSPETSEIQSLPLPWNN